MRMTQNNGDIIAQEQGTINVSQWESNKPQRHGPV